MKDWSVNISCDFKDVIFHCSYSDIDDHVIEYIKSELLKGFEITIDESKAESEDDEERDGIFT